MDVCCERLVDCEREMSKELELIRLELSQIKAAQVGRDKSMEELTASVSGLVDAWHTGTGMVTFIKWLSTSVAAVSLVWHAVKDFK